MKIRVPDQADVADIFDTEDDKVSALQSVPAPIIHRLNELEDDEGTITLARDWEGCIFGIVDDSPTFEFDVLAFTENGHVGYGGVNQPQYFDTVAELRES